MVSKIWIVIPIVVIVVASLSIIYLLQHGATSTGAKATRVAKTNTSLNASSISASQRGLNRAVANNYEISYDFSSNITMKVAQNINGEVKTSTRYIKARGTIIFGYLNNTSKNVGILYLALKNVKANLVIKNEYTLNRTVGNLTYVLVMTRRAVGNNFIINVCELIPGYYLPICKTFTLSRSRIASYHLSLRALASSCRLEGTRRIAVGNKAVQVYCYTCHISTNIAKLTRLMTFTGPLVSFPGNVTANIHICTMYSIDKIPNIIMSLSAQANISLELPAIKTTIRLWAKMEPTRLTTFNYTEYMNTMKIFQRR